MKTSRTRTNAFMARAFWAAAMMMAACAAPAQSDRFALFPDSMAPAHDEVESLCDFHLVVPHDLGGDAIVLPAHAAHTIRLEARLNNEAIERHGLVVERETIRWETDGGELFDTRPGARTLFNSWRPPAESQTTTVQATYQARLRTAQSPHQYYSIRRSAAKRFINATRSEALGPDGFIGGFFIGSYPNPFDPKVFQVYHSEESRWPSRYPERYVVPQGFYRIDAFNIDIRVSPHFTLRFFAMDYPWRSEGFPQYIALDPGLIRKLEDLLGVFQEFNAGIYSLSPICGFRSPAYNLGDRERTGSEALKVVFSQHQYGKAIDMIVDQDGDLVMDDLNGDGFHDMYDAAELIKYINVLDRRYREAGSELIGGAGLYSEHDFGERPVQSPYVHMDTRGFLGDGNILIRWPAQWPNKSYIRWSDLYPTPPLTDIAVSTGSYYGIPPVTPATP
ncbi:MAG: hypothetical protein BWZ10_01114 [candidate division BRC1 bacterium ADurb.BinA364]|nr:MAG: hypothetical protein BWZ10_01114 [candidate division BRC1 bacterium ADurb.BinA364]